MEAEPSTHEEPFAQPSSLYPAVLAVSGDLHVVEPLPFIDEGQLFLGTGESLWPGVVLARFQIPVVLVIP